MPNRTTAAAQAPSAGQESGETIFESIASICSVLAVGLFVLTFVAQNMVIPSGSMENTLLVGDHLVVDHITLAPPTKWIEPLVYYREPRRGDVVVFIKPVFSPGDPTDADGNPTEMDLVKRLVGAPGDHIHLHNGTVIINDVAQSQPYAHPTSAENFSEFLDDFPAIPPADIPGSTESWDVAFPKYIDDGNLVVPPSRYFMMGDNRHNSEDSRYWGFAPRANVLGRPLFNYWSFRSTDADYEQTGLGARLAWMGHVALRFFTETRWSRTFHVIR